MSAHRPKRDNAKAKELADLKRENHQLKRAVSRLRKQVDQSDEFAEEQSDELIPMATAPDPTVCPLCNSTDVATFTTPSGSFRVGCRHCQQWQGQMAA